MSQLKCLFHSKAFLTTENIIRMEVIDKYVFISVWVKETVDHCLLLEICLLHRGAPSSLGTRKREPEKRYEDDGMGNSCTLRSCQVHMETPCLWDWLPWWTSMWHHLSLSFFCGSSPGHEQNFHNSWRGSDA